MMKKALYSTLIILAGSLVSMTGFANSSSVGESSSLTKGSIGGTEVVYINPVLFFEARGGRGWTNVNLSQHGIPSDATEVIVRLGGQSGGGDLEVWSRAASGMPELSLFHLAAHSDEDEMVQYLLSEAPVTNGRFQYRVSWPGGSRYANGYIVGYKRGDNMSFQTVAAAPSNPPSNQPSSQPSGQPSGGQPPSGNGNNGPGGGCQGYHSAGRNPHSLQYNCQ